MTKKQLILTIDEEVIEKAKKHIPNISGFVEGCLKHHLGLADGTYPIVKDLDILDQISKLQVQLFILNENFDVEESRKQAEEFEKGKAWRFLWNDYRVRLIPDEQLLAEAEEKLQMHSETLEDLLDELYEVKDEVDTEDWDQVYDWWKNRSDE